MQTQEANGAGLAKLDAMLHEDTVNHVYQLDRSAFTDEELFELELKYIFEGNWVYLAHESQIPNVNDFLTVFIGRQPVVIAGLAHLRYGALRREQLREDVHVHDVIELLGREGPRFVEH